jgi:hypothetical protein
LRAANISDPATKENATAIASSIYEITAPDTNMIYTTSKFKPKKLYNPAGINRKIRTSESVDDVIKAITASGINSELPLPTKIFLLSLETGYIKVKEIKTSSIVQSGSSLPKGCIK